VKSNNLLSEPPVTVSPELVPETTAVLEALSTRVLARQRHEAILGELRTKRAVRVSELAVALGVSDMTVRRDLDVLEEAGLLDKVHGGATARSERSAEEPGFVVKSLRNTPEKRAIAAAASELVLPGTAIGIAAGTTTWQLAYRLLDVANLIVVTNSIRVADVFHQNERSDRTVILTGGIRTPSDALVGSVAASALRTLHLDNVFMGSHGMSARGGFTSPNMSEAETNRAFIDASDQLVILCDHTKWDVTVLSSFASLEDADVVISDTRLPSAAAEILQTRSARVILADADSDSSSATELA
jgi:DeoR/GlpR family transcriptional regulator of sugar metabolism